MGKAKTAHFNRLELVKPFIGRVLLGFTFMLIAVVLQLSFPKVIAYFVDNVSTNQPGDWLVLPIIVTFFGFVTYCAATALRFYLFESTGSLIVRDLREKLYRTIIKLEIGFFDTAKTGELSSRLTVDTDTLKDAVSMNLAVMIRCFFVGLGAFIMAMTLSPLLSGIVVFVLPITLKLTKWLGRKLRLKSKALQESISSSVHIAQESFSNVRIIQAFNQSKKTIKSYCSAIDTALQLSLENAKLIAIFTGLGTFSSFSMLLITFLVGGILITSGDITLGDLTSFILYAGMMTSSVNAIGGLWGEWMSSFGATEHVFDLLEKASEVKKYDGKQVAKLYGKVEFDNVSFSYPGRREKEVLNSFSLRIEKGEKVALVGPSGAGKTTVVNLLLGFYGPKTGHIKFDDIDSSTLDFQSIREHIAIVEQEPVLFSGTIAENIGYTLHDPLAHPDETRNAAKMANAHDFITNFPEGYKTIVGERGVQLSGGQKQRIAIARAVIKNPKILILDEATSALDSESELLVQDALNKLMHGRTTIIIAHRYSTIANADKLVVLENGKIIQCGAHQALIENENGLYHKLIKNQIS